MLLIQCFFFLLLLFRFRLDVLLLQALLVIVGHSSFHPTFFSAGTVGWSLQSQTSTFQHKKRHGIPYNLYWPLCLPSVSHLLTTSILLWKKRFLIGSCDAQHRETAPGPFEGAPGRTRNFKSAQQFCPQSPKPWYSQRWLRVQCRIIRATPFLNLWISINLFISFG